MAKTIEAIYVEWQTRLTIECPNQNHRDRISILNWLLGGDRSRWETLFDRELEDRFYILKQRYLGRKGASAYRNLIERLGNCIAIHIEICGNTDRDRTHCIVDLVEGVIQEMLQHDRYIDRQILWIGQCTRNPQLREALLLSSIEAYCLAKISDLPRLVHQCLNYLHRDRSTIAN